MKQKQIDIAFPTKGLNRKAAYRQQAPYSSPELLNVRAIDAIDSRERGGSRPGLTLSHVDNLGAEVRMLSQMTLALGDGFTNFSDTFDGTAMSSAWSQAAWETNMPEILSNIPAATIDTSIAVGAALLEVIPVDTTKAYTVELFLVPWRGSFDGKYRLFFGVDNGSGDWRILGAMVELIMSDAIGAYSGTLETYHGSGPTHTIYALTGGSSAVSSPGWLSVQINGTNVQVFWNGEQLISQTIDALVGSRIAFGMECDNVGGLCLANVFRVQYYSTGSVNQLRDMLIASANGNLFYESTYGRLSQVSTSLTLESGGSLLAAQDGQELFIADYGDVKTKGTDGAVDVTWHLSAASIGSTWQNLGILPLDMVVVISDPQGAAIAGTYKISSVQTDYVVLASSAGIGACSFRIERAPKIYDPLTQTLSIMSATLSGTVEGQTTPGQVPTGCPVICRYMDRLVFAGAEVAPNVWYMGRQGYPLDWDYSQLDARRAVAGNASPAGIPGDPIMALVPHSDDYLVIGCTNSLWRMAGDPASGGTLGALSHAIGIVGPKAWCLMPDGMLIFLSQDGLYSLDAGGSSFPSPLSRENLPREFLNINPNMVTASLEYDLQAKGVHIFLSSSSSNARQHWWLDNAPETSLAFGVSSTVDRKAFWPLTLISDHEPTATCVIRSSVIEDSGVILGGRDGLLRRFMDLAEDDCGNAFASYVTMGPIALNADSQIGTLRTLDAVMGEGSGDVTWDTKPSLTFEGSVEEASMATGTWTAGLNATERPACSGQAFSLEITGTGRKWATEQITGMVQLGGKRRIL